MMTTLHIFSVVDIKELFKLSSLSLLKGIMEIGVSQQKICSQFTTQIQSEVW